MKNRHLLRIFAFIMSVCMIFSLTSCSKGSDGDKNKDSENGGSASAAGEICIPYSREDGMNPFTAKSLLNSTVMPLVYSGLFSLNEKYETENALAASVTVSGTEVTVTLDSGSRFSDGSTVSADDVVYSFNQSKTSAYYSSMLLCVDSAVAAGRDKVVFKMTTADKFAAALLTFPVVKLNTAAEESSVPVGAGAYVYTATADGGTLTPNTHYIGVKYKTDKIVLSNTADTKPLMHSLVIGNITACFDDLSGGESERINASSVQIDLNNLVFLGLNADGAFSDAKLRSALSGAIDRDKLINSGFEGFGTATQLPFNPVWYGLKGITPVKHDTDSDSAYLGQGLSGRTVKILVCSDNNFKVKFAEELASELSSLGVKTNIVSASYDAYKSGVESGGYDIYIGEYKLTGDMNISGLINDEEFKNKYLEMLAGTLSIKDFVKEFESTMPFVPVAIRNGVLAYSRDVENEVKSTPGNVFSNLTEWSV